MLYVFVSSELIAACYEVSRKKVYCLTVGGLCLCELCRLKGVCLQVSWYSESDYNRIEIIDIQFLTIIFFKNNFIMIIEFSIEAGTAQPILVVVNNIHLNLICTAEDEEFTARTDVSREEPKTAEGKTDAAPHAGTDTED